MIDKNSVNRVLRKMTAAREMPKETTRYYFYRIDPGYSINFNNLTKIIKGPDSPEKQALIKKLQGGITGPKHADYFAWSKFFLRTNAYSTDGSKFITYECPLKPDGTKAVAQATITPTGGPDPKTVEEDFDLFGSKQNMDQSSINVQEVGESYYVAGDAPGNFSKVLVGRKMTYSGKNYQNFEQLFNEYRMWIGDDNVGQLFLPNFETPKSDGVPGGHYVGGPDAYQALVGSAEKEVEEKPKGEGPSLEEDKKEETKSPFEPVTPSTAPNKGDIIDTPKTAKEERKRKSKGDYSSEPYSGGTDVMQRLVKDQRKHMDIRRAARKLVALQTPGTPPGPPGTDIPQVKKPTTQKSDDSPQTSQEAKALAKAKQQEAKGYRDLSKALSQAEKMKVQASSIRSVINKYLS